MTVQNSESKKIYIWDNETTEFSYPQIQKSTDLYVSLHKDNEFLQNIDSSKYSLSNPSSSGILTITDSDTLAIQADKILLMRTMDFKQELDLGERDFPPEDIEKAFDKETMTAQQLNEALSRCVVKNTLDMSDAPVQLPSSDTGKLLVWNEAGNLENSENNLDDVVDLARGYANDASESATLADASSVLAQGYANNASSSADSANESAISAAESAASVNLPTVVANTYLKAKSDASGYDTKTVSEVITDLGIDSKVESIVAGDNVTVDNTDPLNPVISADNKYPPNHISGGLWRKSSSVYTNTTHYYPFDSDANDDIGSANWTPINSPTYTTGLLNGAISLSSASSQYLTQTNYAEGRTTFTLSFWVKPTALSYVIALYDNGLTGTQYSSIQCNIQTTGAIFFRTYTGNTGAGEVAVTSSTGLVEVGTWYNLTFRRSTTRQSIFLDGVEVAYSTSANLTSAVWSSGKVARLGYHGDLTYSNVDVDNVLFFANELSDSNILEIYNSGTPVNPLPYFKTIDITASSSRSTDNLVDFNFDATSLDYSDTDNWAGLSNLDKSPNMTSNTAPSGYVTSAGSTYSTYSAYKAMDGVINTDSNWISNTANADYWQAQFPTAIVVDNIDLTGSVDGGVGSCIKNGTLLASNNGTDWTTLYTFTDIPAWGSFETRNYSFENTTAYSYYRINTTETQNSAKNPFIVEVRFKGYGINIISTTIHYFADNNSGSQQIFFDTSSSQDDMGRPIPDNITDSYRWLDSFTTDSNGYFKETRAFGYGKRIEKMYNTSINDNASVSTTARLITLSVPTGFIVSVIGAARAETSDGDGQVRLSSGYKTSLDGNELEINMRNNGEAGSINLYGIKTNTSGQIWKQEDSGTSYSIVYTSGYIIER